MKPALSFVLSPALAFAFAVNPALVRAETPSDGTLPDGNKSDSSVRTGLLYSAPEGCPDPDEYERRVEKRAPNSHFVEHDASQSFVVTVSQSGDTFFGSFRVRGGSSSTAAREVSSQNCDEVVDALAVVGGIALSPSDEDEESAAVPVDLGIDDAQKSTEAGEANEGAGVGEQEARARAARNGEKLEEQGKQRKEQASKKLRHGHLISVDMQVGATMDRLAGNVTPRLDWTIRTGAPLWMSHNESFLWGFVPRIRGHVEMRSQDRFNDYQIDISGFGFAAGACYTPYFDPDGFKIFGCADFGANRLIVDAFFTGAVPPPPPADQPLERTVPRYWTGALSFTLEAEFKIVSFVHGALRAGIQQETAERHAVMGEAGEELLMLSNSTFVATGGIGVHF